MRKFVCNGIISKQHSLASVCLPYGKGQTYLYFCLFVGDTVAAFMSGLGQTGSRGATPSSAAASHAGGSVAGSTGGTIVLQDSPQLTTKVLGYSHKNSLMIIKGAPKNLQSYTYSLRVFVTILLGTYIPLYIKLTSYYVGCSYPSPGVRLA